MNGLGLGTEFLILTNPLTPSVSGVTSLVFAPAWPLSTVFLLLLDSLGFPTLSWQSPRASRHLGNRSPTSASSQTVQESASEWNRRLALPGPHLLPSKANPWLKGLALFQFLKPCKCQKLARAKDTDGSPRSIVFFYNCYYF